MTATPVLDAILAAKAREDDAARELLIGIAEWADLHTTGALMPDLYGTYSHPDEDALQAAEDAWVSRFGMPGADTMLSLAGAGAPEVSDFAVTELATALGRTRESGRLLVGDVIEAKHRLPRVWARLVAGQVTAWRVRRLTEATRGLSAEAAAFVDAQVAHVVHTTGPAVIHRLVLEATARFDPETTEVSECDTKSNLCFDLDLDVPATSVGTASTVSAYGRLDRADAEDLEDAIRTLAHQMHLDGSTDPLDIRRAHALGLLALAQAPGRERPPVARQASRTGGPARHLVPHRTSTSAPTAPQDERRASRSRPRDPATRQRTATTTSQPWSPPTITSPIIASHGLDAPSQTFDPLDDPRPATQAGGDAPGRPRPRPPRLPRPALHPNPTQATATATGSGSGTPLSRAARGSRRRPAPARRGCRRTPRRPGRS